MKDIRLAFLYSTLKYVEMFILAIVNILLARKIGPAEMGYGMSFLLFVTYSNYFNLGGPQVYLKMKAIGNRVDYNIISKNIILALLFSLFIPLILFDNIDDSIFIGLVSITVLLRSYYLSRCRLKENLKAINIINIFGSFSLLLLFFLFVNNFTDYIKMWFVSNLLVLIIYVFYEVEFTRKLINGVFFKVNFDDLMFFYGVGIKLSLIGLVTTLFLSMDRLMISMLDNDQKTLGVYQLSDTMSMLFYVFITNVQFYFYPKLIKKLSLDINFRKKYIKFVKIFSVSFIIILPLIYYVSSFAFPYIFPGYMDLNIYFTLSVAVKLSVLGVSLLNVIYISDNNEMDLIKKLSLYLATVFIVLILFYFSIGLTVINIPIIISLSLIIISLLDKHESRKNNIGF